MENLISVTEYLGKAIANLEEFTLLSNYKSLPVICCKLSQNYNFTVFNISNKLRERGWIVPAYTMAPNAEHIAVLRIVIREGFSLDMAEMLFNDLKNILPQLHTMEPCLTKEKPVVRGKKTHKVC